MIMILFFFSSRRRHTRWTGDWSSDVCSSDLDMDVNITKEKKLTNMRSSTADEFERLGPADRKSTRLNSSHPSISYAVFCLKKKKPPTALTFFKQKKKTQT